MHGAALKLAGRIQNGDLALGAEAAKALPHDLKVALMDASVIPQVRAVLRARNGNVASNSLMMSLFGYSCLLALEQSIGSAQSALMQDSTMTRREAMDAKCRLLGCSEAELMVFEKYLAENQGLREKLVGAGRKAFDILGRVPFLSTIF